MRPSNRVEVLEGLVNNYRDLVIDDPHRKTRDDGQVKGIINQALKRVDFSQIGNRDTTIEARFAICYGGFSERKSGKRGYAWLPEGKYFFVLARKPEKDDLGREYTLKALKKQ